MLVNFMVKNFKSFDEETLLDLTATKRLKLDGTLMTGIKDVNVLPVVGIYGANGSGKSNLVNALDFVRRKVVSHDCPFPVPFKLACQSRDSEPSSFAVLFIDDKKVMYHYGFSVIGDEVLEEWLSAYYTRRETMLFERSRESVSDEFDYAYGKKFRDALTRGRRSYLDFTTSGLKKTDLLLSELARRKGNSIAQDVYAWFEKRLMVIKPDSVYSAVPDVFILDDDLGAKATEILQSMDFDFNGFHISSREVDIDYLLAQSGMNSDEREKLAGELENERNMVWKFSHKRYSLIQRDEDGKLVEKSLLLKHKRPDGSYAYLSVDEASSGFRRMLDLVVLLLDDDMMRNSTVVIDEIERSLHTLISKHLVDALKASSLARGLAFQLIFITHDINLLDLSMLRRDEIMFMEKDRHCGASHITNFAEFKSVAGLNIKNGYLDGRFGAIPIMHHNLDWR